MSLKELSIGGRSEIFKVSPDVLQIDPDWNVRKDGPEKDAHIRELADSIAAVGVRIPLVVRMNGDTPYVVDGECRLLATRLAISEGADIKTIPVVSEDRYANDGDRVITMLTCNEGKPLSIPEQAEAYKRLIGWGWSEQDISKKSGYSVNHIKSALAFSSYSPELQKLVTDGVASASYVISLVNESGQEKAIELLSKGKEMVAATGKKKVTKKTVEDASGAKKVNWKSWGPQLHGLLARICDKKFGSQAMADAIAEGNELLAKMGTVNEDEQ